MAHIRTLMTREIQNFKATWPCHGLPDNLDVLLVEFADNGDLVDIEAWTFDDNGHPLPLDTHDFDGPALVALVEDCKSFGEVRDI